MRIIRGSDAPNHGNEKGQTLLVTANMRFPRFYVTSPAPCPYLPGREERKVFAELNGSNAGSMHDALSRIGFRRSQTVAYRPSCHNCKACLSVRVVADKFQPSATQRRVIRRNADLVVTECKPWATSEQFALLQRYLDARHPGGGMAAMDEMDFADMVEHTPVETMIIEYREASSNGMPGRLVGACLTDRQDDGLSMIYSFYEPDHNVRAGLGNFIILDHIARARAAGLPYVYLGYWVEGSARMQYKVRYRPLERLLPDGWARFSPEEQDALITATVNANHTKPQPEEGCSKDGVPGGKQQYQLFT